MTKTFDPEIGRATRWQKGMSSPHPSGRPKVRLISEALRIKLAEIKADDPQQRTYAEIIAAKLIETASSPGHRIVAAVSEIIDRLEGRAHQSIAVADITQQLRDRSDDDLRFYLAHGHRPEDEGSETPRTN